MKCFKPEEVKDEKEIFALLARFVPYVKFKVEPVLSVDEVIETVLFEGSKCQKPMILLPSSVKLAG